MPGVRIDVNIAHDRGFEFAGPVDHLMEVVNFEPKQNAVTDWLVWVTDGAVVVIRVPIVKLQDQPVTSPFARMVSRIPQPLILGSAMTADTSEEVLIPSARNLNVATEDEWLGTHVATVA